MLFGLRPSQFPVFKMALVSRDLVRDDRNDSEREVGKIGHRFAKNWARKLARIA